MTNTTLSDKTKISIEVWLLVFILLSIIGSAFGCGVYLQTIRSDFNDAIKDIAKLRTEQYSLPMAERDALRHAIENPGIRVPDPAHPGSVIVVAGHRSEGN